MLHAEFFSENEHTKKWSQHRDSQQMQRNRVPVYQKQSASKVDETTYAIEEADKLFWMFYILHYDYDTYKYSKRTFQFEKQQKFSFIESLSQHKQKLKSHKLKLTSMIEDLGTSHTITLNTFVGLCCAYDINIVTYKNKIAAYYKFNAHSDNFSMCDVSSNTLYKELQEFNTIDSKFIIVTSLDKPLKSVTSYKKQELQTMAALFDISITRENSKVQKTKPELYQEIMENI
jgi:hypothetical protein